MARVWIEVPDPGLLERYLSAVSEAEAAHARRIRSPVSACRWLASRALLRQVAAEMGLVAPAVLPRRCAACGSREHGAPALAAGVHISVARCPSRVAVALSDQPLGIDVEEFVAPIPISSSVFSTAEQSWSATASGPDAVRLWTAKEAIGKLCGLGLRGASGTRTTLPRTHEWSHAIDPAGADCVVRLLKMASHSLVVAARQPARIIPGEQPDRALHAEHSGPGGSASRFEAVAGGAGFGFG